MADSANTHIPVDVVLADIRGLSRILAVGALATEAYFTYTLGGAIPSADDGLNSLSPTRRNAALLFPVPNEEFRDQLFSFFYGGLGMSGDFPGSSCHNHALLYEMGPIKTNWIKSCPIDWPQHKRDQNCISQNEAAWGTSSLARLEAFKSVIDPNNLFICTSGLDTPRLPRWLMRQEKGVHRTELRELTTKRLSFISWFVLTIWHCRG